jgi:hypothetical protein
VFPKDNGGGQSINPFRNEMEEDENTSIDMSKNSHNRRISY